MKVLLYRLTQRRPSERASCGLAISRCLLSRHVLWTDALHFWIVVQIEWLRPRQSAGGKRASETSEIEVNILLRTQLTAWSLQHSSAGRRRRRLVGRRRRRLVRRRRRRLVGGRRRDRAGRREAGRRRHGLGRRAKAGRRRKARRRRHPVRRRRHSRRGKPERRRHAGRGRSRAGEAFQAAAAFPGAGAFPARRRHAHGRRRHRAGRRRHPRGRRRHRARGRRHPRRRRRHAGRRQAALDPAPIGGGAPIAPAGPIPKNWLGRASDLNGLFAASSRSAAEPWRSPFESFLMA